MRHGSSIYCSWQLDLLQSPTNRCHHKVLLEQMAHTTTTSSSSRRCRVLHRPLALVVSDGSVSMRAAWSFGGSCGALWRCLTPCCWSWMHGGGSGTWRQLYHLCVRTCCCCRMRGVTCGGQGSTHQNQRRLRNLKKRLNAMLCHVLLTPRCSSQCTAAAPAACAVPPCHAAAAPAAAAAAEQVRSGSSCSGSSLDCMAASGSARRDSPAGFSSQRDRGSWRE